jgi:DNA-directed RNA polymerase subunit RPC12/RpoP
MMARAIILSPTGSGPTVNRQRLVFFLLLDTFQQRYYNTCNASGGRVRMKQMRMFEYTYTCENCGRPFDSIKLRGGITRYCLPCSVEIRRTKTRARVAKHRAAKREAAITSQKTADEIDSRPASRGGNLNRKSTSFTGKSGGLYATTPEPQKTQKRKALGLS